MAEAVGGLTGAVQGSIGGVINQGQTYIDRILPPERRSELSAKASKFATEKPMLASFILSHLALSGVPLAIFATATITILVFALLAGLVIALLGALLFTAAAVGFALLILLPTLFITTAGASFIWLWGVAGYYILKWFNKKEIPGIHKPLAGGIAEETGLDAITEDLPGGDVNGAPKEEEGKQANGSAKAGGGGGGGGEKPDPKKAADIGKVAGKTGDVGKVKDVAGGAKGAVPGKALG